MGRQWGGLGCVSSNAEPGGRLHSTWHLSTGSPHCLLTSTTYGLFNLDPLPQSTTTPPTPPPPFTLTDSVDYLFSGFSFYLQFLYSSFFCHYKPSHLDKCYQRCPPNGENRVVIYTTTLRGIRKTFEDCNADRSAIEIEELMNGKGKESTNQMTPPRVFIKGRYIGGADEVMRIMGECWFDALLKGLSKRRAGEVCSGCGHVRFLPCFRCNRSCKMAVAVKERRTVVVRCTQCNESGLMHCPFGTVICS
ncbi:hypothetical protein V6Z11_D08G127700 [Gossypium hirsutum]